jgi:hypothetical protein
MSYKRKRFAVLGFSDEESLLQAVQQEFNLGELLLQWNPIDTKLCAICDNSDHLVAECPTKSRREQWQSYNEEQANKFRRLYQRFKPAKTMQIRNSFIKTNPPIKRTPGSYASAARNSMNNNLRTSQTEPNDLSTVLNMLKEIKEDIIQIKLDVQDLNERVKWIESTYDNETPEMDTTNETNEINEDNNTPAPESQDNPTQDIKEKQRELQNSINKIDANMSAIFNVLGNVTSSSLVANTSPFNNH